HRLLSFMPLDATFSVGEYAKLAHAEIDGLLGAGHTPIVVGGTGLYLRPAPSRGTRERLMAELDAQGAAALHRRLAEHAPSAAQGIGEQDWRRIVHALELLDAGELLFPREQAQLW